MIHRGAAVQIAEMGRRIADNAGRFADLPDIAESAKQARDDLTRIEARLQQLVTIGDKGDVPAPEVVKERLWDAWQRAALATKHLDDAIVILLADLEEPLKVAKPDAHVYTPYAAEENGR